MTGSGPESYGAISRVTEGCMDALFAGGSIAADTRPESLDEAGWANTALGVRRAEDGLADYVLSFYIQWHPSESQAGRAIPASIRYRVVKVTTVKVLLEGELTPPPDNAETIKKLDFMLVTLGESMAKAFLGRAELGALTLALPSGPDQLGDYL